MDDWWIDGDGPDGSRVLVFDEILASDREDLVAAAVVHRAVDAELAHVITLDHVFGRSRDQPAHQVLVIAGGRLTLPDVEHAEGFGVYHRLTDGREPFEPWRRAAVELLTAYVGVVVIRKVPGTAWGLAGDGELALSGRGGTGLLHRVYEITRDVFGAPEDQVDPRRLRRLADDMIRWTTDRANQPGVITVSGPQ